MQRCFMLAIAAGLLAAMGVRAEDDVEREIKKLGGVWTCTAAETDGKKATQAQVKMLTVDFDGEKNRFVLDGKTISQGTQKLTPDKRPKAIDIVYTEGFFKGKTRLGIYDLDGDTLKLCLAAPDGERPTAFESKPGSKQTLQVLKRAKP